MTGLVSLASSYIASQLPHFLSFSFSDTHTLIFQTAERQSHFCRASANAKLCVSFRRCKTFFTFLPRCMECQRGPATRKVSVCLSVCSSACQTRGLWQNGKKDLFRCFIPYERSFSLVVEKKNGGRPILPQILDLADPVGAKTLIFNRFARSASAVAPSKKVQLTLIGSPTRFPMSLRWTSYVASTPPRGGG